MLLSRYSVDYFLMPSILFAHLEHIKAQDKDSFGIASRLRLLIRLLKCRSPSSKKKKTLNSLMTSSSAAVLEECILFHLKKVLGNEVDSYPQCPQ
jgi:hypothetical protein